MQNHRGVGIEIVSNGIVLPEYTKDGKTYIAAPWNSDYQIRVLVPTINGPRGYKRFLAILSVDGLDAMTGRRASANSDNGYVVDPPTDPTANDIPGFRLNDHEVAAFHFGDRRDSYATQLGKPENVGVIGAIFWSEREYRPAPVMRSCGGATRGGASRGGHDMGTEFGDRKEHVVHGTEFEKDVEIGRFIIEYASYDSLKAAGIINNQPPLGKVSPFVEDTGCTPPPGWRGNRGRR